MSYAKYLQFSFPLKMTRRVTESSQGRCEATNNWDDMSCQLTPGKAESVLSPGESSTPVVTTASFKSMGGEYEY